MADHFFYAADLSSAVVALDVEESTHCIRTLRHRIGDNIVLTDGKGSEAKAVIVTADPKACVVQIVGSVSSPASGVPHLHLAIAPTKNVDRMEWLVEKAVEIGVYAVTFVCCDRSERTRLNMDRLHRIAVAALKQSQTLWLPLVEMTTFDEFMEKYKGQEADKYIAWCDNDNTRQFSEEQFEHEETIVLVGPEGDFSPREVEMARRLGYAEVKLGNRRLRTETAGLYVCMTLAIHPFRAK